uniref:Sushi domain-containing protein n=1 Tax=Amphimedon queenslandica TaxID=400682 RepID=A0A1X7UL16_AMPQE
MYTSVLRNSSLSVPISRFYSFAGSSGDQTFTNVDDQATSINLSNDFIFYGYNFSTVFINNNGLLSFHQAVDGYTSDPFPLPQTLIAPFWADVDTRNGAGVVYYRETTASAIVSKVAQDVQLAFPGQPSFTAKSVVIVTWYRVGYYEENNDKLNTFQCVLATDGSRSYVLFLYLDDGINWVTGDASGGSNGFGGTEAYVGFNSGGENSTYFAVEGARTPAVVNIETTSNVRVAGLWIFQVNGDNIITSTTVCGTPDQLYDNATILSYNSISVNSTATYSCEDGYSLVGDAVRTCLSSGNWSGNPPYCQIVNCSELLIESNGGLPVFYSSNSYSYNSTATYSCKNGYNLVGNAVRTCLSSGNWSGSPPYCQIVTMDEGEGSNCMARYKHEPSLYIRICCNSSNLGQTIRMREGTVKTIILCPIVKPQSCPPDNKDCRRLFENGNTTSGVYTVNPDGGTPFEVYCDMETDGGGWTVFQRRQDGSVDFYRNWTDYEYGFGDLTGEFWLGLSKIHRLTKEGSNTLRVDLGDFEGNTAYANYSTFGISDSCTKYILTVGRYSGTAGDSLDYHNSRRFTTRDNDNDASLNNCAQQWIGAWWYIMCYVANLNGRYYNTSTTNGEGIVWARWKETTLKFSEMKTRNN